MLFKLIAPNIFLRLKLGTISAGKIGKQSERNIFKAVPNSL
jgi:hypothetical protein